MSSKQRERAELCREIVKSAERLEPDHCFNFSCHPGVSCFNVCCADVNIVLSPLDILRMSRRLGVSTTDFLAKHTLVPFTKDQKLPFVFLKMQEDDKRSCPFVSEQGCTIYEDRPWPCRMYPVGQASPGESAPHEEEFFFMMREDHCKGHQEERTWTIREWMEDQGVSDYREVGELFKGILLHPYLGSRSLDPARMEMFYMACYDLDKFREFVFKSRFLERFRVEPGKQEAMRSSDMELLRFAFQWLRFALFGEMTMEVNPEHLSERERKSLSNK